MQCLFVHTIRNLLTHSLSLGRGFNVDSFTSRLYMILYHGLNYHFVFPFKFRLFSLLMIRFTESYIFQTNSESLSLCVFSVFGTKTQFDIHTQSIHIVSVQLARSKNIKRRNRIRMLCLHFWPVLLVNMDLLCVCTLIWVRLLCEFNCK